MRGRAAIVLAAVAFVFALSGTAVHAECVYGPSGVCESEEGQPVTSLRAVVRAHHGSSYKHPGYSSIELVSTPEAAYMTANEPQARIHRRWLTEEVEENVVTVPWDCRHPGRSFHLKLTARGHVGDTVTTHVDFHAQLSARWCAATQAREEAQRLAAQRKREVEQREARRREEEQHHKAESTCTNGTYVNSAGNTVCKPEPGNSSGPPAGATAECADGEYSFSESRSGTCSSHGGVARWL
jgi:Protein of unknown function (DUF3761)